MKSADELFAKIVGLRPEEAQPFDPPAELGFHCPVCKYKTLKPRLTARDSRHVKPRPHSIANSFYTTPAWRELVARIIAKRGRRCEECGEADGRIDADHVVELQDGGAALDESNVRLLCRRCHSRKTIAARTSRARAREG